MNESVPETQYVLRSNRRVVLGWLFAGPLTPAFWIWLLNIWSEGRNSIVAEPIAWLGVAILWMITGLPSTVAVSIGFWLYSRLDSKSNGNLIGITASSAAITMGVAIIAAIITMGVEDFYGAFVVFQIGLFLGSIAALVMATMSFGILHLVAIKPQRLNEPTV